MKKIFTLVAATLLTVASFAADRKPSVTLKASNNYEVVIDGISYSGNGLMEISLMRAGQHSIKVYEQKRGGFFNMRRKRVVDASTFQVGRNDVNISIDFRGQISITEDRFGHDQWDNHNDSQDNSHDKGFDKNDHYDSHDKGFDKGFNKNDHGKRF
jgi:hypothetical protein